MTTQRLPTDKHGNIYYGPRTWREVVDKTGDIERGAPTRVYYLAEIARMAQRLDAGGFTGLAARMRREYPIAD